MAEIPGATPLFRPIAPSSQQIDTACRQVGMFMLSWAFLEQAMNDSIKQIFRLDSSGEGDILVSNIQFRDKVNIIRSSIAHHSHSKADDWRKAADDTLVEISDLSINYRNVVAHNPFFPETDGTLVFYRTTAKKKLDRPTLRLTLQEYTNLLDDIERLKKELPKILKDLEPGPNDRIVAALLGMPTIGPAPLNYEGLLGRQPQDSPNSESDPATNQKSARTPEAPRG